MADISGSGGVFPGQGGYVRQAGAFPGNRGYTGNFRGQSAVSFPDNMNGNFSGNGGNLQGHMSGNFPGDRGNPQGHTSGNFPGDRGDLQGHMSGNFPGDRGNSRGHMNGNFPGNGASPRGNINGNFQNNRGNTREQTPGNFFPNQGNTHFPGNSGDPPPGYATYGDVQTPPPSDRSSAGSSGSGTKPGGILSLLDGVKIDREKAVIILLIIILARNGADVSLIMALGYLLM